MQIRHTRNQDLPALEALFDQARAFMRRQGNHQQWADGHPHTSLLAADIDQGISYVMETEDGQLVGTFALIPGTDPTYAVIEGGHWRSDRPYATIHRLASNGVVRGVARACFEYASQQYDHLRIDTHPDNQPMQRAILAYGFEERGRIYLATGSMRLAYDYLKDTD